MFHWFPTSTLGTQLAKLQLGESGSRSFQDSIPKLELVAPINVSVIGGMFPRSHAPRGNAVRARRAKKRYNQSL
jgi:hypothetical protein